MCTKRWFISFIGILCIVLYTMSNKADAADLANDLVFDAKLQSDGKIIIGGWFTAYNGESVGHIARLYDDGTLDTSFNMNGANDEVSSLAVQTDDRIIVGGKFTMYDGTARNGIARLNPDGSLDTSFDPGAGAEIEKIILQADGKILIGGNFTSYNSVTRNRIARLNADGSLDTSFDPGVGPNLLVEAIAIQSDGRIMIGGKFDTVSGVSHNRIARLNTDGSLDTSFDPGTGAQGMTQNDVESIAIQSDGKIVIGGDFYDFDGTSINRIARLNADGSLDTSFDSGAGANRFVNEILIQSDGKIVIGGYFYTYNNEYAYRIARLNADGSVDSSFFGDVSGPYAYVETIAQKTDGTFILGGQFSTSGGLSMNNIVHLAADGTTDQIFGEVVYVTTDSMTNITDSSAMGNITVVEAPYSYWGVGIEWGDASGLYTDYCDAGPGGVGTYQCEITGLYPETTYYVRARAYNESGDVYGQELFFTTASAPAPVTTNPITEITETTATGNVTITQDFQWTVIDWGTESGFYPYSCNTGGISAGTYECDMTGLSPNTTYYVVAHAYNEGLGDVYGDEIIFTTLGSGSTTTPDSQSLTATISETLTLNCGSHIDLDNGSTLIPQTPQTNITTCSVTTNDSNGYDLQISNDRGSDNTLYHTTQSASINGQIQDKSPWTPITPNAQSFTGDGLAFGILSSNATKNETWWGNGTTCTDSDQLYAGIPHTAQNIMEHTSYSNTQTDTEICYQVNVPSTQIAGEYTGSVTYTASGRP